MKTTLLTALAAAALAAGCSKSDTGTPCVKIAPTIQTRVTGLHFDTGDRIGLSIAKGSETYAQNVPMTYDGTAFTAADLLWYNDSNEKSTLTAYHPYSEQGMPAEFSVATDQTSGGASSDLLVAVKKEVTPSSAPVGMLFYHVMSQLTIVLTNNSDAPVTGVTVGGLVPTAVVDFTVPSAAAKSGAAAADVEAFEVTADAAYRAILVPQQATLTVTVATGDGKSRSKTLSSAQLESGKRYDMSVVVTNIDIDVELSGEVVDWGDGGSLDGGGDGGDPNETVGTAPARRPVDIGVGGGSLRRLAVAQAPHRRVGVHFGRGRHARLGIRQLRGLLPHRGSLRPGRNRGGTGRCVRSGLHRPRLVGEGDRPVGARTQHPEAVEPELLPVLGGMAHLEDEAVDLARSLQFTDARLSQQAAQHTVVAFEQLRKNNAYARLLDDERPELGHDEPLVRPEILRYGLNQHD